MRILDSLRRRRRARRGSLVGMSEEQAAHPGWSDDARETTDIGGRPMFSQTVASRIDQCPIGQPSTVFGLVGPWGSGKTTLLRNIERNLSDWTVVWFSPWSVADAGSVTAEFVSTLGEAFPKKSNVRAKLVAYGRFGAPVLKLIPVAGDAAAGLADKALDALSDRPAWHTAFGSLSEEIAKEQRRVLIVVDDVDRLDGEELRALLRVVRLLGRFTNVHYLMAYDEETIDRILGTRGVQGASSEFMEKIVQFPFEVPPVSMLGRRRWSREIVELVSPVGVTNDHAEHLITVLATALETPRAAGRLREQVMSLKDLAIASEVDMLDFVALAWLRIAHHRVWDDIRLNRHEYIDRSEKDPAEVVAARLKNLHGNVGSHHVAPVEAVIGFLFDPPTIESALAGERRWRMQRGRYFDRYFHVGIEEDDVSEQDTEDALRGMLAETRSENVDALRSIVLESDEERSVLALEIANTHRGQGSGTSRMLLDLAEEARRRYLAAPRGAGMSAADRLLTREIFFALEADFMPLAELVARFGYREIVSGAQSIKRARRLDEDKLKGLYAPLARHWIGENAEVPVAELALKPEVAAMAGLVSWIGEPGYGGFLENKIAGVEDLIQLAMRFVSYSTVYGGPTEEYDLRFEGSSFANAAGDALARFDEALSGIPMPDVEPYAVSDRLDPDLSNEQRRDYAIRQLQALIRG